jgi:hypothetical protein
MNEDTGETKIERLRVIYDCAMKGHVPNEEPKSWKNKGGYEIEIRKGGRTTTCINCGERLIMSRVYLKPGDSLTKE